MLIMLLDIKRECQNLKELYDVNLVLKQDPKMKKVSQKQK